MRKSFLLIRVGAFIVFSSVSLLLGCTRVNTIGQYDALYEKYIGEKYTGFSYYSYDKKVRNYVYSHGYQNIAPKFDTIRHRHILIILCGRFVNLLRGDYNEETPWVLLPHLLPNLINKLHYEYNWKKTDFMWAYNMSMNSKDQMIYYARKFLNSSNGINSEVQIFDLETSVRAAYMKNQAAEIKKIAQFCRDLEIIYNMMEP